MGGMLASLGLTLADSKVVKGMSSLTIYVSLTKSSLVMLEHCAVTST